MLSRSQLETLTILFRHGSDDASTALSRRLDRAARVSIEARRSDSVDKGDPRVLGDRESPVCCCGMTLCGRVRGQLLLLFDDVSGLALADMFLGQTRRHLD